MTTRIKLCILADIPEDADVHHSLLQHIRNFDVAHPGCHFEITEHLPNISLQEAIDILRRVNPELKYFNVITK